MLQGLLPQSSQSGQQSGAHDKAAKDGDTPATDPAQSDTAVGQETGDTVSADKAATGDAPKEQESGGERKAMEMASGDAGDEKKPSQDVTKEPIPDLLKLDTFQKMLASIQGNIGPDGSAANKPTTPQAPPSLMSQTVKPGLLGCRPPGITTQQLVNVMSAGSSLQQQQLLNAGGGSASPILAMFIESQIRQQLLNLEKVNKARLFMTRLQQQQQLPQQQQQQQHQGVFHFTGSAAGTGAYGRKQGLLGNQPAPNPNAPSMGTGYGTGYSGSSAGGGLLNPPSGGLLNPPSGGLLKTPGTEPAKDTATSNQHGTVSHCPSRRDLEPLFKNVCQHFSLLINSVSIFEYIGGTLAVPGVNLLFTSSYPRS